MTVAKLAGGVKRRKVVPGRRGVVGASENQGLAGIAAGSTPAGGPSVAKPRRFANRPYDRISA
jgi:hypothetical protein